MHEAIPELEARARAHFWFSKEEQKDFIIALLLVGLALGFDDGQPTFELFRWLINLISCFFIAAFALFINIGAQRLLSVAKGYILTHKLYLYGTIGGAVIGFASLGKLVLFAPFELIFTHHEGLRLGRFRYGLNVFEMGTVALMGPLASLLAAIIFKAIYGLIPLYFFLNLVRLNVFLAIATMLPIPKLPGSYVFFGNPTLYILSFAFVTIVGLLLLLLSPGLALMLGFFLALIIGITYFFKIDFK